MLGAHTQGFIRMPAPDLDQALIQLVLGRGACGTAEEQDAQTPAWLVPGSAAASWR